jgi:hypothetical protein
MANWCENQLYIKGSIEEIKRYKDSLLKAGDKYYPFISTVPLPELQDHELDAYIEKEHGKNLFKFHYRVTDFEVIECAPDVLEIHFETAYSPAKYLGENLFPELSIVHKFFGAMSNIHGFAHFLNGKLCAEGFERGDEQDSRWRLWDYNPYPIGVNPLEERLKNYVRVPLSELKEMEELDQKFKEGA